MELTTEPKLDRDAGAVGVGLVHLACLACSPDTGLCGADLASGEDTDDDAECVVCIELAEASDPFCERCGADWRITDA